MRSSPAVAVRAFLALLMIGAFYATALALAGAMILVAILSFGASAGPEFESTNQGGAKALMFLCALLALFAAGMTLWLIRPRGLRFVAPGPKLERNRHPGLFDEIDSVARAMGQSVPDEIHLTAAFNASIGVRSVIPGIGRRRVLFLGLPLVRAMTRAQLRGVIAHELGHAHAGDLRLGPMIHFARRTIVETLLTVSPNHASTLPQRMFAGYAALFVRLTQAVSRHQELVADEIAARTEGPRNVIAGLEIAAVGAPAFAAYWSSEFGPVLSAGFLPPLAAGFDQFLRSEQVARFAAEDLARNPEHLRHEPYDSHPALRDRVAALEHVGGAMETSGREPAIGLLEELPDLERELVACIVGKEGADRLAPIAWSDVGRRVWLQGWRELVHANAKGLRELEPGSLPALAKSLAKSMVRFEKSCVWIRGPVIGPEARRDLALAVLGAALSVLLVGRGGAVEALPGKAIRVRVGSVLIEPFEVMPRLAKGELTEAAWREQCEQLGIAGVRFSEVAKAAA